MDHTMGKTESMTFKTERNHGLYDKADNIASLHVQIQNYDLLCVQLYLHHYSK